MDDYVRELILASGVAPPRFVEIELYPTDVRPHSFEAFLISNRVHPLLILHILQELGDDAEFMAGHAKLRYWQQSYSIGDEEADDRLVAEFGPTLLSRQFSADEVFQSLLSRMGIEAIVAKDAITQAARSRLQGRISSEGRIPSISEFDGNSETIYSYEEGEIHIMVKPGMRAVITEQCAYIDAADKSLVERVRRRVEHHREHFRKFLEERKETAIPHTLYVTWLLQWFPGQVHLRTLEFRED